MMLWYGRKEKGLFSPPRSSLRATVIRAEIAARDAEVGVTSLVGVKLPGPDVPRHLHCQIAAKDAELARLRDELAARDRAHTKLADELARLRQAKRDALATKDAEHRHQLAMLAAAQHGERTFAASSDARAASAAVARKDDGAAAALGVRGGGGAASRAAGRAATRRAPPERTAYNDAPNFGMMVLDDDDVDAGARRGNQLSCCLTPSSQEC